MCRFKSGIIFKGRVVLAPDGNESHSDLLEKLGVEDNTMGAMTRFVRAELLPKDGNKATPIEKWRFNVDQDMTPEWFDEDRGRYEQEFRDAVKEYMKDKPVPRSESIISKEMMTEILVGALYITGICLSILFVPAIRNLFGDVDITYLKSAVFAVFMMAITFNGFNARTSHVNVFEHLGRNKTFIGVMLSIFALQFVFVTFGGEVLSVESLDARSWLICVVMAFIVIPIDMVRKLIMRKNLH